MRQLTERGRAAIASLIVVATIVAVAVSAGVGFARDLKTSADQYQYGKKVTICHHTKSTKHPTVTITVSRSAVAAHLKHGDTLGACAGQAAKHTAKGKAKGKDKQPATQPTTSSKDSNGSDNGKGGEHGKSGEHGKGK